MKPKMSRRTFLQGTGGLFLYLPILDIMLDGNGALAAGTIPKRFGVFFDGQSLGADHDPINFTIPTTSGRNYVLSAGLDPLGKLGLQGDVSVVSGLSVPGINSPGGRDGEFHADSHFPQITGVKTTENGESVDQIVARAIGAGTKFNSLHFQAQPEFYVQGYDFGTRNILSFKNANGQIQEVQNETSPLRAYQSLFMGGGSGTSPEVAQQILKRKSILDFLSGQRQKLMSQLGASDQQRMSQHFDQIRDIERSLASSNSGGAACLPVPNPGADPTIGPRSADEFKRNRLFIDMIYMAFVCDMTRVATHMITTSQCHVDITNFHPALKNVGADQHDLGHSGGGIALPPAGVNGVSVNTGINPDPGKPSYAMSLVHAWHVDHFSYLLNKLKNTSEGAGNALDNCALVMLWEGGHGGVNNDAGDVKEVGSHSTENMMVLVAGRAGGLRPGKHIIKKNEHPARVVISAMKAVTGQTKLGSISGDVPELFTD